MLCWPQSIVWDKAPGPFLPDASALDALAAGATPDVPGSFTCGIRARDNNEHQNGQCLRETSVDNELAGSCTEASWALDTSAGCPCNQPAPGSCHLPSDSCTCAPDRPVGGQAISPLHWRRYSNPQVAHSFGSLIVLVRRHGVM